MIFYYLREELPCIKDREREVTMLPGFRLIDLSVPLEHCAVSEPLPAQIRYIRHDGEGLCVRHKNHV